MAWESYIGWCDPDPKKSLETKLRDAVAEYTRRYGKPGIVLMNSKFAPLPVVEGLEVKDDRRVPKDYFWLGRA